MPATSEHRSDAFTVVLEEVQVESPRLNIGDGSETRAQLTLSIQLPVAPSDEFELDSQLGRIYDLLLANITPEGTLMELHVVGGDTEIVSNQRRLRVVVEAVSYA